MHWLVLGGLVAALLLIQLGALSVWVVVLALALKGLLALLTVLGVVAGAVWYWRRSRRARPYRNIPPPKQLGSESAQHPS